MLVGIKKVIINNETIQVKTGSLTYSASGSEKTPHLGEDGSLMHLTQEHKVGKIKAQLSTVKAADSKKFLNLEDGEIIIEKLDGGNIVGTNMYQIAVPEISVSEGTVEFEFAGNVVER